ncbi:hypothetical protein BKA61DRAFT_53913 [Leptodontidium sp. MPI-SDFR-AT-0119]|nr:hypothetical protein BKA61DRAFT_53913 [Leptodontidium sp. MPI-SDFR-AT-0119]
MASKAPKASKAMSTSSKSSNKTPAKVGKAETAVKMEIVKVREEVSSDDESSDDESEGWPFDLPPLRKDVDRKVLKPGFEEPNPIRRAAIRKSYVKPLSATGNYITDLNKHNKGKHMSKEKVGSILWLAEYGMLITGRELSYKDLTNDYLAITDAYNRKWKAIHEAEFGVGTYLAKGHNDMNSAPVKRADWEGFVKRVLQLE